MSASTEDLPPPPPYSNRTLYDETLRSKFYPHPSIGSVASRPNLVGRLEHHALSTDGSFSICIAGGEGVFISQALYDSIPKEHRPALDTTHAGQKVSTLLGETMTTMGSTLIPFFLTMADSGEKFRVILHALVVPDMFINMFIGTDSNSFIGAMESVNGGFLFGFVFGEDRNDLTLVQGI